MRIVNVENEKIKACFQFEVENCMISVSTIFNENKVDIAIFDKDSGKFLYDKLSSISAAISWVNSFGPRN